jgi:glutathione-regulated potassium-efflux system ancillary protein KefF
MGLRQRRAAALFFVVSTAAGGSSTYGPDGRIGVSLADVFLPMKASALHAGMTWLPPLVFESASSDRLPSYPYKLIECLKQ